MSNGDIEKTIMMGSTQDPFAKSLPTATLLVNRFDQKREQVVIGTAKFHIGRGEGLGNDFILADPLVSGKHVVITYEDGFFYITDLNSSNGTKLNGQLLEAHKTARLENQSNIEIGNSKLVCHLKKQKKQELFRRKKFEQGEVIYREGDQCSEIFVILEGKVAITKTANATTLTLGVLEKGEMFGESAFTAKSVASDNAKALEKTETLVLNAGDMDWVFSHSPETIVTLAKSLSVKLADLKHNIKPGITPNLSMSICLMLSYMSWKKGLGEAGDGEQGSLSRRQAVNTISEILSISKYITELVIESLISLKLIKTEDQQVDDRYLILPAPKDFIIKCKKVVDEFGASIFNIKTIPQNREIVDLLDLSFERKIPMDRLLQFVKNGEIPPDKILLKKTEVLEWLKAQGIKAGDVVM